MHLSKLFVSAALAGVVLAASPAGLIAQEQGAQAPGQTPAAKEPVDFRTLKSWLPEKIAGVKRVDAEGEKVAYGEMKFSTVNASYYHEDGQNPVSYDIEVMDYAAIPSTVEGMKAMFNMEMEQETDTGYAKTTKIAGFPAMEQFDRSEEAQDSIGTGEVQLLVGERYIVRFSAHEVTQAQFAEAVKELPLAKLAELK